MLQREEDEFIREQKAKLIAFLKESGEHLSEDRKRRSELLERYKKESSKQKVKGNIA